jgi:hypothetical protein
VGAGGVVDRWGSPAEVFILPGTGLAVMLVIRLILRRALPGAKEARLAAGVLCGVSLLFLSLTVGVTLSWLTFDGTIPAHRILAPVAIGIGACFAVAGISLRKNRPHAKSAVRAMLAVGGMFIALGIALLVSGTRQ